MRLDTAPGTAKHNSCYTCALRMCKSTYCGNINDSVGSCSIAVDSSYSEGVVCVRSESTSSESLIHHQLPSDPSPTLFLEFHCIANDHPITLNASQDTLILLEVVEGTTSRGSPVGAIKQYSTLQHYSHLYVIASFNTFPLL